MLRNYWYTACGSSRLQAAPLAARVLDYDLVLFRDSGQAAHALRDRCCHRGVKLSLGRITEGLLACGYHGWRYEGSGHCVHVPSLTAGRQIPETFRVPSYPCLEQDGYVWVWLGEDPPTALTRIPKFESRGWLQGASDYKCDALKVIGNNLDWCHPAFTHEGTHPAYFINQRFGFREFVFEIRMTETGFVSFTPATANDTDPVPDDVPALLSFELPNRVMIKVAKPNCYTVVMHIVPTGPQSCRLDWLSNIGDTSGGVTWTDEEPQIFNQDRIIESSQELYDQEGDGFECSVTADASTLLARRIIKLAHAKKWEEQRHLLPQRRLVNIRA